MNNFLGPWDIGIVQGKQYKSFQQNEHVVLKEVTLG